MRFITIPETATLEGQRLLTFVEFIDKNLLGHPLFGNSGHPTMRAMMRLGNDVRAYGPGDVWPLDEADWTLLKRACDEPGLNWPPLLARAILSYFDAIVDAPTTAPKPPEAKPRPEPFPKKGRRS